ncbi:transmembrane protein 176A-like [Carettochelys insculpta]|uniref:transmembrane protein 176A-like n=1 Tax=Carettochelys insculpta TaxID=44489 RepID=UPI003EB90F4D
MPSTMVKLNDMEMSAEGSDKTVIQIHITQESWLSSLLQCLQQHRAKSGARAWQGPAKGCALGGCCGEQKVLGACQVLLGLLCGAFGVILCFAPNTEEYWKGTPFWAGAMLVLSGVFCVVSEKRGTCCWVSLASFLSLASAVSLTVALVLGLGDISRYPFADYNLSYLCDRPQPAPTSWGMDEPWRVQNCKQQVGMLKKALLGLRLLLALSMGTGLCIGLYCFLHGCWALCCRAQDPCEESKEPLLPSDSVPPPDEERAQDGEGV